MVSRGMITVTTVLLCLMLALLGPAPTALGARRSKACCTSYNRKPIPFQRIKGYREQTTKENCRIEAIILYTAKNMDVCVTRKDEWVRKTLELLSSKLKKMSKTGSAARETEMKKTVNLPFNDGNGSFFTTTESFLNDTESFY